MAKRYVLFGVGLDGGKPALFSYQLNRLRHIFVGLQLHYIHAFGQGGTKASDGVSKRNKNSLRTHRQSCAGSLFSYTTPLSIAQRKQNYCLLYQQHYQHISFSPTFASHICLFFFNNH